VIIMSEKEKFIKDITPMLMKKYDIDYPLAYKLAEGLEATLIKLAEELKKS